MTQTPPAIPEFESYEEEIEWRFGKIAESIKTLAERSQQTEAFLQRGADMIQYKIPGHTEYSNLRQIFDDLYSRINTLEEKLNSD